MESIIQNIEIVNVADFEEGLSIIDGGWAVKFTRKREFVMNSISALEISGDYGFYDLCINRCEDLIKNITFENVHHYAFLSIDKLAFKNFPEVINTAGIVCMQPVIRLYFELSNIPRSFSVSYDSFLFPYKIRNDLYKCQTNNEVYYEGFITEKVTV